MAYQITYTKTAIKSLNQIDRAQQKMIIAWIEKNLIGTENPRSLGKNLKGNLKEYWRYRVGNYRILADINDNELTIIVFNMGHRRDIYS